MKSIAKDLVYLADVQIRLGSELITVELSGTFDDGLTLEICQLTTRHPNERAPLLRFWRHESEGVAEQNNTIEYDLDSVEFLEGFKGPFRLRLFMFEPNIPKNLTTASVDTGKPVYRITLVGRDAPLRAVQFEDKSDLTDFFGVRFTA